MNNLRRNHGGVPTQAPAPAQLSSISRENERERPSIEEARRLQLIKHNASVEEHKKKEWEKEKKKIEEKAKRYQFLDTTPGYRMNEENKSNDNDMKEARRQLQEKYNASIK